MSERDEHTVEELYNHEPGLWGYFARGAPAMLTENIQPAKHLANGTWGFLHSLTFETTPQALQESHSSTTFSIITLDAPPLTVNFQLKLPQGDSGDGIDSLVEDCIVVPVKVSQHRFQVDTNSLYAILNNVPKSVHYRSHAITLAFAVTDYKLQGKTLDDLILSINPRSLPPHLDLKGFYVLVSRVRKLKGLHLLAPPGTGKRDLRYLFKLVHKKELAIWNGGYDAYGYWDVQLA